MTVSGGGSRAIHFFGGASILIDGQAASGRATHRHRIALLALLLAHEGHPVTRDKLIAYLWPEKDADGGRNLLKVAVHELRKEFGEAAIRTTGDQLSANPTALDSDIGTFRTALERKDDRNAAAIYGGPFLDGFFLKDAEEFEHWVESERSRLASEYAAALERLAHSAEQRGDTDDALNWFRALTVHDPYQLDAAERLVRALVRGGDSAAAIQFAESFARRRHDDLGIDDDGALMSLARSATGGKRTPPTGAPHQTDSPTAPPGESSIQGFGAQPAWGFAGTDAPPQRRSGWRWVGGAAVAAVAMAIIALARGPSLASIPDRIAIRLIEFKAHEPADRTEGFSARPAAAVRAYLEGEIAYRSSRYADAERAYAKALDIDSTFAIAGMQLALANSWTTINENYGRGRDAALKYPSSLSPRDRAFFKAYFGPDPALGAAKPAPVYLAAWEDVVEKWPHWAEAWYQLGDRYYHYGSLSGLADPLDRARGAFRRALSEDSALAAPLHHLVELYAARRERDELLRTSQRYFALNPAIDRNASAIGWETAIALGDSAWIAAVRANFPQMSREDLTRIGWVTLENGWERTDAVRAESLLVRKSTTTSEREKTFILEWAQALNDGRPGDAHAAAAALGAIFPDHPVGALWDLYASLFGGADAASGNEAALRLAPFASGAPPADHVARDQHHLATCMTGYWRAEHGDPAGATTLLRRLNDDARKDDNNFSLRNARVCGAMLSAAIAVHTHATDASRRVAQLDTILLSERVPPHAILGVATLASARLHVALGEDAAALVAARRREHLTGDPLFLAEELRTEKSLLTKP